MEYGCIGEKLSHSFSVDIHNRIGSYRYDLIELSSCELNHFFSKREFKGINITIPYKKAAVEYIDVISESAKQIGAVNTVVNKEGILYGYNTDFDGLTALINKNGFKLNGKTVAVLGSGGTAETAFAVCRSLGAAEIIKVSRTEREGFITYKSLYDSASKIDFILNATPCGMFPFTNQSPVDLKPFVNLAGVIDVIYNPLKTELVLNAEKLGIKSCGGLYMLVSQAVYAAQKFIGSTFDGDFTDRIFNDVYRAKLNTVFIGMPSSGKTTVGALTADKFGTEFYDTDRIIENRLNTDITNIFSTYGEPFFRKNESEVINELSLKNNCVISTGGGAVLDENNIYELKKNGRIFFLDRPLKDLSASLSRPLMQSADDIQKLYTQRIELYKKYADVTIDASGDIFDVLNSVSEAADEYSCY